MKKSTINLSHIRYRYHQANRPGKTKPLNELCDLYSYNRKYLLQVFNHLTRKKSNRRWPAKRYDDPEMINALLKIWLSTDQMCSKRLKAAIELWLPAYEDTYGLLSNDARNRLITISPATIDRLLKSFRVKYKRRGLTGTRPGYLLKNQIPIKTDHCDVTRPGFMEADTVAHCGNSIAGDFVWSLTLT